MENNKASEKITKYEVSAYEGSAIVDLFTTSIKVDAEIRATAHAMADRDVFVSIYDRSGEIEFSPMRFHIAGGAA